MVAQSEEALAAVLPESRLGSSPANHKSVPPGSMNWYQAFLGRIKHCILALVANETLWVGQICIQIASTIFRRRGMHDAS